VNGVTFRRSDRALWRRAGTDVVAASPDGPVVHHLTGGASAIWRGLEEPGTVEAIVEDLATTFGVAPEALAPEVHACLNELVAVGLVELST
jgi:hypothetical protein